MNTSDGAQLRWVGFRPLFFCFFSQKWDNSFRYNLSYGVIQHFGLFRDVNQHKNTHTHAQRQIHTKENTLILVKIPCIRRQTNLRWDLISQLNNTNAHIICTYIYIQPSICKCIYVLGIRCIYIYTRPCLMEMQNSIF